MVKIVRVHRNNYAEFVKLYKKYKPNFNLRILESKDIYEIEDYFEIKITRKYKNKNRNIKTAKWGRYQDDMNEIICGNCGWIHTPRLDKCCPNCHIRLIEFDVSITPATIDRIRSDYNVGDD